MATLWRYRRDGQEFGPVPPGDLKMLAESQRLRPIDLVCKDGTSHWFPARSIRGLFPKLSVIGQFVNWWGPTGLVCCGLAVLAVGVGLAFLFYAIDTADSAPPPAPPSSPAVAAPNTGPSDADRRDYGHLRSALHEMRAAREEIQGDGRELGDRSEDASRALDRAVEQTERAMRAAGMDVEEGRDDPDAYRKHPDHPHLNHALEEIVEAKTELRDAHIDFGGERDRAIRELSRAAEELEKALPSDHRDKSS